jgi:hypothetical protein
VTPEQLAEAKKQKRVMEALLEHEGFKLLRQIGLDQSLTRKNKVLLEPTENPLGQEFMKGEVQGIELMLRMPDSIIESSKAMIALEVGNDADQED